MAPTLPTCPLWSSAEGPKWETERHRGEDHAPRERPQRGDTKMSGLRVIKIRMAGGKGKREPQHEREGLGIDPRRERRKRGGLMG